MKIRLDDYIDADVSYLVGLIIARGTLSESHGIRQLTIQFPYSSPVYWQICKALGCKRLPESDEQTEMVMDDDSEIEM